MWQPVLMINGFLLSVLGFAMFIPAALDIYGEQMSWSPFLSSAIVTLFVGLSLFLANRMKINKITLQQGYLLTVMSWASTIILASLPFVAYGVAPSYADALFESTSGISTTGATIFKNIEGLPKSILLWRSMLNGFGGVGIVIFAVAMLPFLGIGGMQIFQRENSDVNEKFMPKFNYIAKRIMLVYLSLNIFCAMALYLAGMSWFDAINHAMSTIATGGFSTKNASVGYFDSVNIEMIISLFMFMAALPMTFYIMIMQRRDLKSYGTSQVIVFMKVLVVYILFVAIYLVAIGKYDFLQAMRYSIFNIISIVTSTGFVSTDYSLWGVWVGAFFIVFALTGGCTGSTSGSIKIFRWQVISSFIKRSLLTATEPNRVVPIKVGSITTDGSIIVSVFVFFSAFMLSIAVLTCMVSAAGNNLETSFSAVIACITNSGPGLGAIVGPSGYYGPLSDFSKYVLSFAMLLGRLEILTVLSLACKSFW